MDDRVFESKLTKYERPETLRKTAISTGELKKPLQASASAPFSKFNSSSLLSGRGQRLVTPGTIITLLAIFNINIKDNSFMKQVIINKFDFDLNNPPSSYSYDRYLDIVEYLRTVFYKDKSPEEGYEAIGYRIGQEYFNGLAGQVMRIAAPMIGPQRGAQQFVRSIKNALPWGTHELEEVRSNYVRYHKSLVGGPPPLMLGLMRSALEVAGAKLLKAKYSVLSIEKDDIVYELEWQ